MLSGASMCVQGELSGFFKVQVLTRSEVNVLPW